MKVLITGASGYIGTALAQELNKLGIESVGVDINPAHNRLFHHFIKLDLSKEKSIKELSSLHNAFDATIHLAGIVGYKAADENYELAIKINSELPRYISPNNRTLFISAADSIYGHNTRISGRWKVTNSSITFPVSHYGKTKYVGEKHARQRGATIFRLGSVYGISPQMRWDVLIHDWIKTFEETNTLEVYQPEAFRNFLSIEHLLDQIIKWLLFPNLNRRAQITNLVDLQLTKLVLAQSISSIMGKSFTIIQGKTDPEKRDMQITDSPLPIRNEYINANQIFKIRFMAKELIKNA